MTKKSVAQKEVTVLCRVELKADSRKVIYQCLSSDGKTTYNVFFFNGKVSSCSCISRKPCYHMTGCQAREDARNAERSRATQEARARRLEAVRQAEATVEEAKNYLESLPERKPVGQRGSLNGNRPFSILR